MRRLFPASLLLACSDYGLNKQDPPGDDTGEPPEELPDWTPPTDGECLELKTDRSWTLTDADIEALRSDGYDAPYQTGTWCDLRRSTEDEGLLLEFPGWLVSGAVVTGEDGSVFPDGLQLRLVGLYDWEGTFYENLYPYDGNYFSDFFTADTSGRDGAWTATLEAGGVGTLNSCAPNCSWEGILLEVWDEARAIADPELCGDYIPTVTVCPAFEEDVDGDGELDAASEEDVTGGDTASEAKGETGSETDAATCESNSDDAAAGNSTGKPGSLCSSGSGLFQMIPRGGRRSTVGQLRSMLAVQIAGEGVLGDDALLDRVQLLQNPVADALRLGYANQEPTVVASVGALQAMDWTVLGRESPSFTLSSLPSLSGARFGDVTFLTREDSLRQALTGTMEMSWTCADSDSADGSTAGFMVPIADLNCVMPWAQMVTIRPHFLGWDRHLASMSVELLGQPGTATVVPLREGVGGARFDYEESGFHVRGRLTSVAESVEATVRIDEISYGGFAVCEPGDYSLFPEPMRLRGTSLSRPNDARDQKAP